MKFLRLMLCSCLVVASGQGADHPNILFFLVDDMGAQDTSVPFHFDENGKPVVTKTNRIFRTPNMKKLAETGLRFSNAYAYSVCSPTRVSILTGQDGLRHKVTTWTDPDRQDIDTGLFRNQDLMSARWNRKGVPDGATLLTELMKQAGYRNLFAGKAHFGPNDTRNGDPLNLGFEVNIAGHGAGGPGSYYGKKNYGEGKWHVPGLDKYHGTETFLTEALTLAMADEIEKTVKSGKPFFAYMSHYAVHAPFEADPRFAGNYPSLKGHDKAYATLIEGMDKSLGDLMAKLDELGVAEDTLIMFYSDNGSARMMADGQPHKGMKGHRHEGGMRVPLIVGWAKRNPDNNFQRRLRIPAGAVEDDMVTCMDILPTLADLAGVGLSEDEMVDGHTLVPYLQGKTGSHRPQRFLAHFPHGRHNNTLFTSYRRDFWKLIYNYEGGSWELYDLSRDEGETTNLITRHPKQALELAKELLREMRDKDAEFPRHPKTGVPVLPDLDLIPGR